MIGAITLLYIMILMARLMKLMRIRRLDPGGVSSGVDSLKHWRLLCIVLQRTSTRWSDESLIDVWGNGQIMMWAEQRSGTLGGDLVNVRP